MKLAKIRRAQSKEPLVENNYSDSDSDNSLKDITIDLLNDKNLTVIYSYILVSSQITNEINNMINLIYELFDKVSPEELKL